MSLLVVRRVDYEYAQSINTVNFFDSCFKSCILKTHREKQPDTVWTGVEMKHKKESEQ